MFVNFCTFSDYLLTPATILKDVPVICFVLYALFICLSNCLLKYSAPSRFILVEFLTSRWKLFSFCIRLQLCFLIFVCVPIFTVSIYFDFIQRRKSQCHLQSRTRPECKRHLHCGIQFPSDRNRTCLCQQLC